MCHIMKRISDAHRFLEDEISPGMCGHDDEDYTILSRACV